MRPPVCEICDADLEPGEPGGEVGGLVTFQPDDRSRAWHRRAAETPGFVGHPPDTGWFCGAHIEAARDAACTMTYGDGLRHLRTPTATTSRDVDPQTLNFADPDGLPAPVAVPMRSADGVSRAMSDHRHELAAALGVGVDQVVSQRSTSWRLDDTHDRSVTHSTVDVRLTEGRPFDVFHRIEYDRVDDQMVARLIEMRVMEHDTVLALVRMGPFDQLQAWAGDERFRTWIDSIGDALAIPPDDLTDPSPDLIGVDLGGGRLNAHDYFQQRWVEWRIDPIDIAVLASSMRAAVPTFFTALGLTDAPTLVTHTSRTWDPMDGAQPPYCPFTDTTISTGSSDAGGSDDRIEVTVRMTAVHWNDDAVANSDVSLTISSRSNGQLVSLSAYGSTSTSSEGSAGRWAHTLRLQRPTTGEVVGAVVTFIAGLA